VNKHRAPGYGTNWKRVLIAFGEMDDPDLTAMTAADAKERESRWWGWKPVREALECIESAAEADAEQDPPPTTTTAAPPPTTTTAPPPIPEVAIAAGSAVTEGADASFTVTASPAPAAALTVSVTVSQSGDFASTGAQTVTVGTSGSATLTVPTTNDSVDEPDGSVTATLDTGAGYTVSSSAGSVTVAVADDDDPPATPDTEQDSQGTSTACNLPSDAITASEVTGWRDEYSAATHVSRWNQVLEALGTDTGSGEAAMTAAQALDIKSRIDNSRWDRTARTLEALEQCAGSTDGDSQQPTPTPTPDTDTTPDADEKPDTTDTEKTPAPSTPNALPEISVVGGAAITEGGSATFTVTADPAPTGTNALTFVAMVTQDGRFTSSDGQIVDSIGRSGSITVTVPTLGDDRDEPGGGIILTLQEDTRDNPRFTVSATQGAATVVVLDDDAPGSGATPTYTEFWAPYVDLITKVEAVRNHELYGQFSSHTDLYDSVLLALGRDVAKQSLEPLSATKARSLAANRSTDIWDEIAPALDWIFHNGPPPVPVPTLDNPLPTSINLSLSVEPTQLTLTDYFGHETGAGLSFTVTLDNPIATISQWDELIAIKNTSTGTATMTVTASDGTNSVSATVDLEAACSPSSRLSSDGTFCVAAQTALAYNGSIGPHPSSPGGPADNFLPEIRLEEGTSNTINVRVWVNRNDVGNSCRMRGYLTIEPQTGGATIPTGGSARTVGNTSSPHASHQGWEDTNCTNGFLTNSNRNYREARVTYNLPAADSMPGTTLNGAKLVYHDMGASGSSVVGTYDILLIHFRDSIATVTATMSTGDGTSHSASNGDFTIKEATSGTATITLSGEHLIGYLAPRMQDIRKGGRASAARMNLEHGHVVYWQPSVCAFDKEANAGSNDDSNNRTATCEVSWDWLSDGSNGSNGTVKLVWHETDGAGWDRPDVHTTEVSTITMTDTGAYNASTNPSGWVVTNHRSIGDYSLEAVGGQNTANTSLGNVTTITEGDKFKLVVVTAFESDQPIALEVRTATNDDGTQWSTWQNLDQEVGHRSLAIQEESEWPLYTSSFAGCFTPGGYNCFGGEGVFGRGRVTNQRFEIPLTFVSHDDNFVDRPERYYQFRVKGSTLNKPNPILKVVEDDGVVVSVHPRGENGQLMVYLAKKVQNRINVTLWSDEASSFWNNWSVAFEPGEFGSKIIDRNCDGGTDDIRVWATINDGQHDGVPEYVDYYDGRVDKDDDRNGEYVLVKCG